MNKLAMWIELSYLIKLNKLYISCKDGNKRNTQTKFDIYSKGAVNQQLVKWIRKLKNLFVAADFKNTKQQRALMLFHAEEDVYDILTQDWGVLNYNYC